MVPHATFAWTDKSFIGHETYAALIRICIEMDKWISIGDGLFWGGVAFGIGKYSPHVLITYYINMMKQFF